MVTPCRHQVKQIIAAWGYSPRQTTRKGEVTNLLPSTRFTSGTSEKTSFKDPSSEAGKETFRGVTFTWRDRIGC
ncbi:hypothetical protein SacazDRAFT_00032 [Saccharomonospora azurea NA-128]|uniref:Uncharacterized protein n=1 Tax=Saccharomonospora azurea NA-128 TaxID=882081 RepID=H8G3E2_9PSEU|nr:hypothetical protein SacazDRAFT_00032 [Saccharomonospora azurea NA-128]